MKFKPVCSASSRNITALVSPNWFCGCSPRSQSAACCLTSLLIAQAARLHDLGKLSISEEILDAPAPLSPSAEAAIREHPEMGKAVLDALFSLGPGCPKVIVYAREICLHHHERWGGEGYPDHLRGDAIPRYVQVVSLADCYDALRTPRSYRPAMVHEAARNLILDFRCGSFDPRLLSCFADTIDACASGLCQGSIQHG